MDKGDIVPTVISIVYGSKALAQKLTSNTEQNKDKGHDGPGYISVFSVGSRMDVGTIIYRGK